MANLRLRGFFQKLEGDLGRASPTSAAVNFAVERQRLRARKRAKFDSPGLVKKCIEDFLVLNETVRNTRPNVPADVMLNARAFLRKALELYITQQTGDVQMSLDYDLLFDRWRFGPGASALVKPTHTAEKISSYWSVTPRCEELVLSLRRRNTYFSRFDSELGVTLCFSHGSYLLTVPKNEEQVRIIAKEPLGNMTLQLAAASIIEGALASVGLDITKQDVLNRRLACHGSKTGGLCTIDLSKASDMFSRHLIRELWPPEWFYLFEALRSEWTELPDGRRIKLHMISTMGNGFTFPMMTLSILSLIHGLRVSKGEGSFVNYTTLGVFGDDIICRTDEYADVVKILSSAGLVVNTDKSYNSGPFRESCGGDYYEGVFVTPFYVKSLDNDSEVYVAMNKVLDWSCRHNIILWDSLRYLKSLLRQGPYLVPEWAQPTSGLQTQNVSGRYSYLKEMRQSKVLHQLDFALPLISGGYVTPGGSNLLFTPRLKAPRYRVARARLPKGYLSGYSPDKGGTRHSNLREIVVSLL